ANGYCRDSQLAVLVAGPAGGDCTLYYGRPRVRRMRGRVQVLLLTSLKPSAALVAAAAASSIAKRLNSMVPIAALSRRCFKCPTLPPTLHSDAGDLFRRNRLISVGPDTAGQSASVLLRCTDSS
uniref:Secreted protein n=1 Tax=Macrostomum lignano TaxID=282301 RepID=A0A1I8FEP1_9PLAT